MKPPSKRLENFAELSRRQQNGRILAEVKHLKDAVVHYVQHSPDPVANLDKRLKQLNKLVKDVEKSV
jgi:hypothetical protein